VRLLDAVRSGRIEVMAGRLGSGSSRDQHDSIHQGNGLSRPLSDTDIDLQDRATRPTMAAPVAEVEDDEDDFSNYCQRCCIPLSDPGKLGWCLRCGYCRYLENAQPIDAYQPPPDPEVQEYVALLRVLGKQLKVAQLTERGAKDPHLAGYIQLIASLTMRCRKPGQTSESLREYADLLRSLGKRLQEAQGKSGDLGAYDDLLQALSQKFKTEMNQSHRQGSSFFASLGIPIPALEVVPEWLAVLGCGWVICGIASFTARVNLSGTPDLLLLWCQAQAALGGLLMVMSHFIAYPSVVPYGLRRHQWGLLVHPRDLWWAVWQRLPDSSWPVWFFGWGLGLALGALAVWLI
jgi:hypothetical protein